MLIVSFLPKRLGLVKSITLAADATFGALLKNF